MRPPDASEDSVSDGSPSADPETDPAARLPWERRLSWRGRLARLGGTLLVVAVLAYVLVGGAGSAPPQHGGVSHLPPTPVPTWSPNTVAGPVVSISGGAWQQVRVPSAVGRVIAFTPSLLNAREAFLCASGKNDVLSLWTTHDGGAAWSRAPVPPRVGLDCAILVSALTPHTFVLVTSGSSPCAQPGISLTSDDGGHWRNVTTLPQAPRSSSCYVEAIYSGSALNFWYGASEPTTSPPILYHSENDGESWTSTSNGLATVGAGDNGGLLKRALDSDPRAGFTVYASDDAGQSWRPVDRIRDLSLFPTFMFAAPGAPLAALLSSDHLLYGVQEPEIPNLLYRTRVTVRQPDGRWAPLPPLPVIGASPTRMGIAQVLTETASGQLLVLGTSPDAPLPAADDGLTNLPETRAQWVWLWSPAQQRWMLLGRSLRVAFDGGALMFEGKLTTTTSPSDTTTIWLSHWSYPDAAGISGLSIYRETLSAAIS